MIFGDTQKLVNARIASTKTKERNLVLRQVDLRPDQAVRPRTIQRPAVAHRLDTLSVRRVANENHLPLRPRRVVQRPAFRNHPTPSRHFVTLPFLLANRLDILRRLLLYAAKILKVFPKPNAAFPASIVTFNRRLETCFSRRHEHRNHVEAQAKSYRFSQRIRRSRSWAVIFWGGRFVKLYIIWQTEFRPMLDELSHRVFCGHPAHRPRADQAAVERNSIKYVKCRPSLNTQILDKIELIEFGIFGPSERSAQSTRLSRLP